MPRQGNGYDCGVYVCGVARLLGLWLDRQQQWLGQRQEELQQQQGQRQEELQQGRAQQQGQQKKQHEQQEDVQPQEALLPQGHGAAAHLDGSQWRGVSLEEWERQHLAEALLPSVRVLRQEVLQRIQLLISQRKPG